MAEDRKNEDDESTTRIVIVPPAYPLSGSITITGGRGGWTGYEDALRRRWAKRRELLQSGEWHSYRITDIYGGRDVEIDSRLSLEEILRLIPTVDWHNLDLDKPEEGQE